MHGRSQWLYGVARQCMYVGCLYRMHRMGIIIWMHTAYTVTKLSRKSKVVCCRAAQNAPSVLAGDVQMHGAETDIKAQHAAFHTCSPLTCRGCQGQGRR